MTIDPTSISIGVYPTPSQSWSHSTCNSTQLTAAIDSPSISAIEADILMDVDPASGGYNSKTAFPVMAHPPSRESELTFTDFFTRVHEHNLKVNLEGDALNSKKILKLDFKEIEVVANCLSIIDQVVGKDGGGEDQIFLNADVLSGPGSRGESATVDARKFFDAIGGGGGGGKKVSIAHTSDLASSAAIKNATPRSPRGAMRRVVRTKARSEATSAIAEPNEERSDD